MFERFGVSGQAEHVYLELVHSEPTSREQLAAGLGPFAAGLDDVIAELSGHGLVSLDPTRALGFQVVAPHRAVDILIEREEQRLAREREALAASREGVGGLLEEFLSARVRRTGDAVETIDEPTVVRARLYQLIQGAQRCVDATHPGAALSAEATEQSLEVDRQLAGRGVAARILMSRESLGPEHWETYLEETTALGHRVRLMSAIPLLQIVIDEEIALLPFVTPAGRTGAKVLHGADLIRPAIVLFDELWGTGVPFEAESVRGMTPRSTKRGCARSRLCSPAG
ncbi:TrmB family transcriptional regulator [Ornithinimicrobium sp. Y1694]|uniref:TrmB family transcriptional regulator n=1 Tax=Ornithinimicrobium sp. Y1694 TaxID=3418590 RepID=UPI003CF4286E